METKLPFAAPPTMRALAVSSLLSGFQGCAIESIPTPVPGEGEILVRIRAAGLGFPDLLMTRGAYQHRPTLPFVPGTDMAGEVAVLGPGVTALKRGDRVVSTRLGGAFAEFGVYAEGSVRRIPGDLDFAEAAACGTAYLTAYVALARCARLQPGEWVLVHGAAGGVGLAAVDFAKSLGARVIAASPSDEKLRVIGKLYAPDVLLNTTEGFRERVKEITGGGANIIYDPVGGDVFDESVRCIAFNGRLLVVGFASGRIPTISVNMPLIKGFSVVGIRAGEYGRRDPVKGREDMETVWKMIASGLLQPHVHNTYPLENWRAAFNDMAERRIVGRAIIMP
jgi:NADPH2:quinone reductase